MGTKDGLVSKPAWVEGNLSLSRAAFAEVSRAAIVAYAADSEACGLLAGPSDPPGLLDEAIPLENLANKLHALDPESYPRTAKMSFEVDARKFARTIETRADTPRPVKVLWHSHLDVGAYFSDTDVAAMSMGGRGPAYDLAYLVVDVTAEGVRGQKLFVWAEGAFRESPLTLLEDGSEDGVESGATE
jgi:proteasome lid subunit RPN8/RPN11